MANNSTLPCPDCLSGTPSNNPGDGYLWVASVVVLAIVVCNMVPLVVMARNSQLRKHRFFRFLICLSINAILTSPFLFTATVFRKITPVDDFSKIRAYFDCMLLQSYIHHGIIALERFVASGANYEGYRRYFTSWRQALYLVFSYVIVIVFACVAVGINYDFDEDNPLEVYGRNHDYILFIYGCTVLVLLMMVTILTSCCTYRVIKSYLYWKKVIQPTPVQHLQLPVEHVQGVKSYRPPVTVSFGGTSEDACSSSNWTRHAPDVNTCISSVETVSTGPPYVKTNDYNAVSYNVTQQKMTLSKPHTTARRNPAKPTASKSKRSVGIIKTFLLVLFVVLCFNVPYWLTRVIVYIDPNAVTPAAYRVTFIITAAQYAMNPIIYFFRIELFRKALVCPIHRWRHKISDAIANTKRTVHLFFITRGTLKMAICLLFSNISMSFLQSAISLHVHAHQFPP